MSRGKASRHSRNSLITGAAGDTRAGREANDLFLRIEVLVPGKPTNRAHLRRLGITGPCLHRVRPSAAARRKVPASLSTHVALRNPHTGQLHRLTHEQYVQVVERFGVPDQEESA